MLAIAIAHTLQLAFLTFFGRSWHLSRAHAQKIAYFNYFNKAPPPTIDLTPNQAELKLYIYISICPRFLPNISPYRRASALLPLTYPPRKQHSTIHCLSDPKAGRIEAIHLNIYLPLFLSY